MRSSLYRFSERLSHRKFLTLIALALVLAGGITYRLGRTVFPDVAALLRELENSWPTLRVRGQNFEIVDDYPPLQALELSRGWRLVFDPDEAMRADIIRPGTVVIRPGRVIVRSFDGSLHTTRWNFGTGNPITVDRKLFRRLGRLLWVALGGAALLLVGPCLLAILALAVVGTGLLLLAEFSGLLRGPRDPFGYAVAFAVLPICVYAAFFVSGLRFPRMEWATMAGYLALLVLSWVWLRNEVPQEETLQASEWRTS
ncbi:MAG: hypothetical protein ONB23_07250 [candidate division KSB1 bacterium]|nr:hypothetical protein [candidate division KSB1 bacterium]